MKVAIIGYGSQGVSAHKYWQDQGHDITVCDSNTDLSVPDGTNARLGEDYLNNLTEFDLVVRSPSVHPKAIKNANLNTPEILDKVTTNTNEFFKACPTANIIGVTGTKGKGTTSTLITKMLAADGKRVHLGGNIGTPPLDLLKAGIKDSDWVVLELANFQLIDLKQSPPLAICLMVEPEHMDWHTDLDEYTDAKKQLFRWQSADDRAVYFSENTLSAAIVQVSPAKRVPYFVPPGALVSNNDIVIEGTKVCKTDEVLLKGDHNLQNVCAAVTAVWQVSHNIDALNSAIRAFSGLPFRLELIRELNGIKYYNDSFGTTPETAIVAIQAFSEPKVLIVGGSDKGADYGKLAEEIVASNVRGAVLLGDTGSKIAELLKARGYTNIAKNVADMQEAVQRAGELAHEGDIILLSPASASFGMFKDYKDRGEQFNQVVKSLV